jgi:hypothetical protein
LKKAIRNFETRFLALTKILIHHLEAAINPELYPDGQILLMYPMEHVIIMVFVLGSGCSGKRDFICIDQLILMARSNGYCASQLYGTPIGGE